MTIDLNKVTLWLILHNSAPFHRWRVFHRSSLWAYESEGVSMYDFITV